MYKLEKLNSSIDIIPLQSSSMDSNSANVAKRSLGPPTKLQEKNPEERVLRDSMIISRVRTYLYENEDKVYIDVNEMADYLQRKYRDYRGKKRGPFRSMVRRAYDDITENLTRQADSHWQDDDEDIDIEVDPMPAEYLHGYKRQSSGKQNGNSSDKELIDISSDDDQVKTCTTTSATSNKSEKDMETVQVAKRPHMCASLEALSRTSIQVQEPQVDTHSKIPQKTEKSRKRPRDKEIESTFDTIPKRKVRIPIVKPTITFNDIGGITKILETVDNILQHIKHPEVCTKLGTSPPRGVLLHGPPGCGKTLLAHAIAGELNMPLLKVAAPELVAGISGESEQRIRELFDQAVAIAPCILFIDEFNAIAPHRATAQKEMEVRIVSQLLSCLDELAQKTNGNKVLLIGATNTPDSIDPALRRAGRFDREVLLGIPDKEARAEILKVHTAEITLSADIDLDKIASLTPGYVGADLVALITEAAMSAGNRTIQDLNKNTTSTNVEIKAVVSESSPASPLPTSPVPIPDTDDAKDIGKPSNKDLDNSDIIVDDDSPVKSDSKEKSEEEKTDVVNEASATVTTTTEEKNTAEDTSDTSESAKVPPPESTEPTSSPKAAAEESQSEPANSAKTTKEPIPSPKETEQLEVTVAPKEIIEPEPIKIQEEEVKTPKSKEEKLADFRKRLQNVPTPEQLARLCVEERDFEIALKKIQPSAKREGFATVPDVTWEDIGSLKDIREELQMTILAPIRYAEHFASHGLIASTGVLLCGPPGCGKTLLAKAIANEAGINFISVKGPELLNMYVGESEKAVRQCFARARNSAPCVIFFDEVDALCPKRSEGENTATSRVVNQMLTEMDGVEGRKDVFLMAASNRPEIIDAALLRPGRLDKILYVGLPNALDRVDILKTITKNGSRPKLAEDVNLEEIAEKSEGYTGADLAALVREASNQNLREIMAGSMTTAVICLRNFHAALDKVRPSVQEKDIRYYDKLQKLYSVKKNKNIDVPMSDPPIAIELEAMET